MKKLLLVVTIVLLTIGSTYATDLQKISKYNEGRESKLLEKRSDETPSLQKGNPFTISTAKPNANLPGEQIGETAYNYQTNDNMHDRIVWNAATNTIHVQWMYGDVAEVPNFIKRRMRYNFYDGSSWVHGLGIPI